MTTSHGTEGGEPRLVKARLIEGAGGGIGARISTIDHTERAYREAWFADFRARWQRDLRIKRNEFYARMAALETT